MQSLLVVLEPAYLSRILLLRLLIVHGRFCWVGVLIGVIGVRRVQFLVASFTVGQDVLRTIALPLRSALGRTQTCDLLIRSHFLSGTGIDTKGHRETKPRLYHELGVH